VPKVTPDDEAPVGAGGTGTAADFDRPIDVEDLFKKRHNGGAGHGTLGDTRRGFVRLRRKGWDDLMALQRVGALTHQEVVIVVSLLTRAGFRPDKMGVVLGQDGELAAAVGVHRNRILPACRAAQALGIMEPLLLPVSGRAGWRFTREAWAWLAGEEDHAPPPEAAARLPAG
jgi:hypothetical protein